MRSIGSLYQFMEPSNSPISKQIVDQQRKIYYHQLTKAQKKNRINYPKRIKTSCDQYKASDKKLIMRNLSKQQMTQFISDQQIGSKTKQMSKMQQTDYLKQITQRYKRNKYRASPIRSILLPKKAQILQLQTRNKYLQDQGLLRALQKIRIDQNKDKYKQKLYQKSFASYSQALSKLQLAPIQNTSGRFQHEKLIRSNRLIIKTKRSKTDLSDTKRIQFQRCLSWAKKHKKDGNYYQKKLGKQKTEFNWDKQIRKRKKLLSVLGEKYGGKLLMSKVISDRKISRNQN